MLPIFFHEMGLATIMVQICQCFMKQDCLNILMIARFTKELVVLNGGRKCVLTAHVLILDKKFLELTNIVQDVDLVMLCTTLF
jgi:hypothetical protein